jgi:hypothetical protein
MNAWEIAAIAAGGGLLLIPYALLWKLFMELQAEQRERRR